MINPLLLVFGHWEHFFGNDPYKLQLIRLENELIERLKADYPDLKQVRPYPLTEVAQSPPDSLLLARWQGRKEGGCLTLSPKDPDSFRLLAP